MKKRIVILTGLVALLALTGNAQSISNLNLHALLMERAAAAQPAPLPVMLQPSGKLGAMALGSPLDLDTNGFPIDTNGWPDQSFTLTYVAGLLATNTADVWPLNADIEHPNGYNVGWLVWTNWMPIAVGDKIQVWWPTNVVQFTNWDFLALSNVIHVAGSTNDIITVTNVPWSDGDNYADVSFETNSGVGFLVFACTELDLTFFTNYYALHFCPMFLTNSPVPDMPPVWIWSGTNQWIFTNVNWTNWDNPSPIPPLPVNEDPGQPVPGWWPPGFYPTWNGPGLLSMVFVRAMPNSTYAVSNSPTMGDDWGNAVQFSTGSRGWGGFVFYYTNSSMFFKLQKQ